MFTPTIGDTMAQKSYREAINEALVLEMTRDPTVVIIGEDVAGGQGGTGPGAEDAFGGVLGVTKGLYPRFGAARVIDTPITESAILGMAAGAATTGLRPVAELMFSDFLGVCFDALYNQAAKFRYMFGGKARTPLVVRSMIGAGFSAAAQHSQSPHAIFTHVPGLKVVMPSSPYDAKGLLIQAIRDDDPVVFLEHKMLYEMTEDVPDEAYAIPFGEANFVREGDDLTIVAFSRMVHMAAQAADVRRNLSDLLLVDSGDRELRRGLDGEGDALRRVDDHGVAVSERELQVAALELHAVTDAEDLHLRGVTLGDTGHQVGHQGPGQPVQRTAATLVVRPVHHDRAVIVARHGDRLGDLQRQGALGFCPSIVISTPAGTGTGCFPIRDMSRPLSPHVREDFAAHALSGCLAVGQQARRRGDDGHAQPAEHPRQIGGFRVHPQTGLGHPAQTGEAALPVGAVLELDNQRLTDPGILGMEVGDVTLLLEDLGDVRLDLRVRQGHLVVIRRIGVAQTRQKVCDRVRHGHDWACLPSSQRFPDGPAAHLFSKWSVGLLGKSRLPAGLLHAGQFAGVGHLAQADPA